jgi:hypothetical protein
MGLLLITVKIWVFGFGYSLIHKRAGLLLFTVRKPVIPRYELEHSWNPGTFLTPVLCKKRTVFWKKN